jgi:glycosyltransferase involved in cell wall biosynthesis
MSESYELTVLMPCLNETKTLGACIEKIHETCRKAGIRYEILVSDNGSIDGSQELARSLGARVEHAEQKGYGAALMNGFAQARGEYVLFADADDTYDFREIPRFWEEVRRGHPVVIGTRLKGNIHPGAMPPLHRYLGTPVLTFLIRTLYRIPISDCNSGMRLLKLSEYLRLKMSSPGMEYASEMLVKLGLLSIPVREIPIPLWPDRRGRRPHLRTWRDGWRHLRFILMYSPRPLLILPGFALYMLGLLGVLAFSAGGLTIGGRLFDYHSQIVLATLGLVGFTMWSFGQLIVFFSPIGDFAPNRKRSRYFEMSLEKKLVLGLLAISIGVGFGGQVVLSWASSGFGELSAIHRLVASLYFVVSGFVSMLLAATYFTFETTARQKDQVAGHAQRPDAAHLKAPIVT